MAQVRVRRRDRVTNAEVKNGSGEECEGDAFSNIDPFEDEDCYVMTHFFFLLYSYEETQGFPVPPRIVADVCLNQVSHATNEPISSCRRDIRGEIGDIQWMTKVILYTFSVSLFDQKTHV